MGIISGEYTEFKSCKNLFARLSRTFRTLIDANIVDDNDFYGYVSEVIKTLGISAYQENDEVLKIENGKVKLPCNFKSLHAAYKCGKFEIGKNERHLQNISVFENDITCSTVIRNTRNCELECKGDKVIERVEIKQYVNDNDYLHGWYKNPILLKLSPNVKQFCSDKCLNIGCKNFDEINIDNGYILTNFKEGTIYIQYYGFPLDIDGYPMIPDEQVIEKACEWYITYNIFMNAWLVDDLTNAQNKWQVANQEYEKYMAEARFLNKLPSFSTMVNSIRRKRSINAVSFFSQQDN